MYFKHIWLFFRFDMSMCFEYLKSKREGFSESFLKFEAHLEFPESNILDLVMPCQQDCGQSVGKKVMRCPESP